MSEFWRQLESWLGLVMILLVVLFGLVMYLSDRPAFRRWYFRRQFKRQRRNTRVGK
ncbi:MAG TPA: hypothetical protein VLE72_01935 [Candidatus Saccharimonadales bacterium]|nr:hypothetical protein [Candidatus Saccharimonadales bacterium]